MRNEPQMFERCEGRRPLRRVSAISCCRREDAKLLRLTARYIQGAYAVGVCRDCLGRVWLVALHAERQRIPGQLVVQLL